jgi:hypothetical protein
MRALIVIAAVAAGCSLLVDENIDHVPCGSEGAIGPPACDVGEICVQKRCFECIATDVCGDGVDNDCTGTVDQDCGSAGAAGSG